MCTFPARIHLHVLVTAAFRVCGSAVQVGVHSGLCVPTRDSANLCVQVGHIPGVCCLNLINIFPVLLQVCLCILSVNLT